MATSVLTYAKALTNSPPKKHLLLGNGFSIALKPKIFSYSSLYDRANFSDVKYATAIFEALATRDFEQVIQVLVAASKLLKAYPGAPAPLVKQLESDSGKLKNILVSAIAENHPDRPYDVLPEQYAACREFLYEFNHVYTLNYDVLLYWSLMQDKVDELDLLPDDGFRHPEEDFDAPYVSWQEADSATVHYLHGALHLFDAGAEITKYTWSKTDVPLLDQIRAALDKDRYPLFVSEGDSRSKLQKILHNAYLHKAYRSFTSICAQVNSALFVFGHSLADNDDHIFSRIVRGKIGDLYVSIFGDPNSNDNKKIIAKASALVEKRKLHNPGYSLDVSFFDAMSAQVWGK